MPEEERKQPPQQPTKVERVSNDSSQLDNVPNDGETLRAGGPRPSPTPDSGPVDQGPINKANELTVVVGNDAPDTQRTFSEPKTDSPQPPPPSASDSGEGEG